MKTEDLLKIMRVLSALESALFASKGNIQDYLKEDVNSTVDGLEKEIIKRTEKVSE